MRLPLLIVLAGSLAGAGVAAGEPAHPHAHGHAHAAPATVLPATRFATDAPLREGMQRVRLALDALADAADAGMPPQQVRGQALAIEEAVQYMFAHCRLAPEPDARLHAILVPLLAAARQLREDPADLAAPAAMRAAVAPYAQTFDDPQWIAGAREADTDEPHVH